MYGLDEFGDMIADGPRFRAYAEAIKCAVRPGDVVVDIGCGPGLFAMLACRAGAARVYAIETGSVIDIARQLAAANGFADRIKFIRDDSRKIQLPERVDAVVSDIRGALPLFSDALPSVNDARVRFLKEGGVQIPQRDTIYAAVLEREDYYKRLTWPWKHSGAGLDLTLPLPLTLNAIYKLRSKPEQLLTEPQTWCTLDYTAQPNPHAAAKLRFRASRRGTGHGITAWFEAQILGDIGFCTAPGNPETVYGQAFFPWLEAVELEVGQEIDVELYGDPVGGDYIWRWNTRIPAHNGRPERVFCQSTFQGAQFSPETLRRRSTDFVPVLSDAGLAERWLLQAMDGSTPLQEIAQSAAERFPRVFQTPEEAFRRVSELAERFSR
jgi:type I protein arginine methyltransferase